MSVAAFCNNYILNKYFDLFCLLVPKLVQVTSYTVVLFIPICFHTSQLHALLEKSRKVHQLATTNHLPQVRKLYHLSSCSYLRITDVRTLISCTERSIFDGSLENYRVTWTTPSQYALFDGFENTCFVFKETSLLPSAWIFLNILSNPTSDVSYICFLKF